MTTATRWTDDRLLPAGAPFVVTTDDGATLVGTVHGPDDGPTVVLPHCWTGAREVWARVVHRLVRQDHRVVVYDQRGHGSSTLGRDGCTIEALGRDLRAVLTELDVHDAVLAGHSMGGMTIQSVASLDPAFLRLRTRGLAMVATSAAGLGRGATVNRAVEAAVGSPRVERILRSTRGHRLVRRALGRHPARADLELTRDLFVACPPDVRRGFVRAFVTMDQSDSLRDYPHPISVLAGTADLLTPLRMARHMVAVWPTATLLSLPGRGHMLPLEAPDEVATAITLLTRR